jgi:hypothetical protein
LKEENDGKNTLSATILMKKESGWVFVFNIWLFLLLRILGLLNRVVLGVCAKRKRCIEC